MLQKVWELQKSITNKIKSSSGNMTLLCMFVFVCFIALIFFNIDYNSRLFTFQSIEDTIGECLSSAGLDNLHESYQPFRDGNVGSFTYDGNTFVEVVNTSDFLNRFENDYNVSVIDGDIVSYDSVGYISFKLSDISIYVDNSTGSYIMDYTLSIPKKVGGYERYTYDKRQVVKYQTRF